MHASYATRSNNNADAVVKDVSIVGFIGIGKQRRADDNDVVAIAMAILTRVTTAITVVASGGGQSSSSNGGNDGHRRIASRLTRVIYVGGGLFELTDGVPFRPVSAKND